MPIVPRDQLSLPFSDDDADESGETRTCSKCGLPWPIADFYVKDRKTGRRSSSCRSCHYAVNRANFLARREREPEKVLAQQCAGEKRWREAHPEKVREKNRKYVRENIERVREAERAYKRANRDKVREKKKRYKAKHKDVVNAGHVRFRAANEDRLREYHKAWRDAHPEQNRASLSRAKHKRRARLAGGGGDHTPEEWAAIKEAQGYMCLMCGRCEPEIKLTKDHVIPISKGGTNDAGNLEGLCRSCNSRKHAKILFLPRNPADAMPSPVPGDDAVQSGVPGDSPSPEA